MADEIVLCRHQDTGEELMVAVSALPYFPDWKPVEEAVDESESAAPAPAPEPATPPKTTRTSKTVTDSKEGDSV